MKLDVGRARTLAWLPQETILFDRVRLRRSIDVDLTHGAQSAVGRSRRVRPLRHGRNGPQGRSSIVGASASAAALVFAETVRLDGLIAQRLAQPAVAGGGVAVASVLKIPGDEKDVAAIRAMADNFAGEVGISAWNGLAVMRLVAPDGAALRHDLMAVLTALRSAAAAAVLV